MFPRFRRVISQQPLGLLALVVAMSGTAYAASLPRNSVGPDQIRSNAVRSAEIKDGSLRAKDFREGQLPPGPAGPAGISAKRLSGALHGTGTAALGSVLGYSFALRCVSSPAAATAYLTVSGPSSIAAVSQFQSINDGPVTSKVDRYVVGTDTDVLSAESTDATSFLELSGTVQLRGVDNDTPVVSVSAHIIVIDNPYNTKDDCGILGTAVPAVD
ncbi:hypothetical protein [Nocardioides dilutus]